MSARHDSKPGLVHRHGRRWFITGADLADGRFVCRIGADRRRALTAGMTPPKLVTFRREFRRIGSRRRIGGLFTCLDQHDPEVVRLGIWIMARTHVTSAISEITPFRQSADVRVRREAARALRRLEAWAELRVVAGQDPDEQVRRLATPIPVKPFHRRLERFAGLMHAATPPDVPRRTVPMFVLLPMGPGRMAKTQEFIRTILERIRQLVRGQ
jgi:hypothetical protein